MRVVVTLPWGDRLGGAEAMLQMVVDGARQAGHEFEFVFFEDGPWPAELIAMGFRVDVLASGRLRDLQRWPGTVARLVGVFHRRQPDVILNWAAKTQLYGALAAGMVGMSDRVVWWQQLIPTGHWIDRWATLLPAAAVGCYSEAAAEAQRRLWPSRETFVVAAGTPMPACNPAQPPPLELPADVPVVGLVGRLQPWKGQDRLLQAHALLRERGLRLHTVIVGGDAYGFSSEYADSLPALVRSLGLDGEVTMTGQVDDAGPYIEQMDVLVNASDPEPFGIVLLEGMARGVAVLAVDSGGPAEFVDDGETGVLARSGEPVDLADTLEPLLVSAPRRQQIGRAGRERFVQRFTDAAMRERLFAQLQALVRARGDDDDDGAPCAVTIVVHDLGPVGGMELVLSELVLGLRALGHPVTVIARTCQLPEGAGVIFHRVRGPARPFLLAYPWFVLAGSLTLWRRRRGIVQATGAIVFGRLDVIAVHYCHQVGPANPSRATPLYRAHATVVAHLKRIGERVCFCANRAATFVCVSDGVAQEMRTHFPELAERVLTIHNGVDTERFAPGLYGAQAQAMRERLSIAPGRLVAAMVGSEWERKGLAPLIEAITLTEDWDVVIAGEGERERYQQLADSLGVGERVHWLGVTREVEHVYALADAFLLPTSYETFSLVTFEAAASGLPILATAVNGVRELIDDGRNGFVITREPRMIAERLGRLAADPQLRQSLGAAAREAALRFSWQEMVTAHDRLYASLQRA